mmetsp:Transcript_18334/g.61812  ORF Transcript_18334/g.61812 Transcript_18334/m.61812 type:complete len:234 (+) Transcript_18334:1148-1849(+)
MCCSTWTVCLLKTSFVVPSSSATAATVATVSRAATCSVFKSIKSCPCRSSKCCSKTSVFSVFSAASTSLTCASKTRRCCASAASHRVRSWTFAETRSRSCCASSSRRSSRRSSCSGAPRVETSMICSLSPRSTHRFARPCAARVTPSNRASTSAATKAAEADAESTSPRKAKRSLSARVMSAECDKTLACIAHVASSTIFRRTVHAVSSTSRAARPWTANSAAVSSFARRFSA